MSGTKLTCCKTTNLSLLSPVVLQVVAHQAAAPGNEGNEDDDGAAAAAAPAAPPAPAKPRRRLVPPMCGETFIKFVYRFLLLEGIADTKRLTCKGCRQGKHKTSSTHERC